MRDDRLGFLDGRGRQRHIADATGLTTNHVTKEIFNAMIPQEYSSRIAFMVELLNRYSIHEAEGRNRSFLYFMTHYHLESSKRSHH